MVNHDQAVAYAAEVTSSAAAASSSKAAAGARERALSLCEEVGGRSKKDVAVFNDYIDAGNNGTGDEAAKGRAAAASAHEMAAWLESVSGDLPATLAGLFTDLSVSMTASARVIERDHSATEINSITDTNNSLRDSIWDECETL
ncbi:hypothetical protein ABH922_002578 [Rhodococcus sp. 27YEA15]|uniref:hypothetical protein n=1 Tax=Rhodococcus sp. 27YEA15 TaxID=3156259 RepID=UPI003C7C6944